MKPETADTQNHYCSNECQHLLEYIHPFWARNAWCSYTLHDLSWYDGAWIAGCEQVLPNEKNLILVEKGWKGNPKYEA